MVLRGAGSALGLGRLLPSFNKNRALQKAEADILEKQQVVDAALAQVDVTLHRDLYIHAYRQKSRPDDGNRS